METKLELADFSDECVEKVLDKLRREIGKSQYLLRTQYKGRKANEAERQAVRKYTTGLIRRYNALADYLGQERYWNIGGK
jgi:hypothetical protein